MPTGTRWSDDPIRQPEAPRLPADMTLRSCPALLDAWQYSAQRLNELTDALAATLTVDWASVCLAGSFGRLDAGPSSDADFLVIVDHPPAGGTVDNLIAEIRKILVNLNFPMPNPQGLFSQPIDAVEVTKAIGSKNDNLHELARRMVLLLEIACVYNERICRQAVTNILGSYLRYQYKEPDKNPLFILNELIRYFRSICVNYELNFWNEHEKWAVRNAKLRHSRVMMYFALLVVILNSTIKRNKLTYISDHMHLTPLERVCRVYAECGERDIAALLSPYSIFIRHINDPEFRKRLALADYDNRYDFDEYALLKTTSEALGAEMTRFVLDRRGQWPFKAFAHVLF